MSTATSLATARPAQAGMSLLGSGVPLSLLLDLAYGPRSQELLETERRSMVEEPPPAA